MDVWWFFFLISPVIFGKFKLLGFRYLENTMISCKNTDTHPALGVPAPGEGARLSHEGVEEYRLPDAHVGGEVDVPVHQWHSVLQAAGAHTEDWFLLK